MKKSLLLPTMFWGYFLFNETACGCVTFLEQAMITVHFSPLMFFTYIILIIILIIIKMNKKLKMYLLIWLLMLPLIIYYGLYYYMVLF